MSRSAKLKGTASVIDAVGAYLPSDILTSAAIEQRIDGKGPAGWIEHSTGVRARRIARADESGAELAYRAVLDLLHHSTYRIDDVDCIIYSAALPDLVEPATAHILQEKLGSHAVVFDVSNACNGFLTGLKIADAFIRTGIHSCILIAAGERLTSTIPWHLLATCENPKKHISALTVGDGAGAALVVPRPKESDRERGILALEMLSDSSLWRACTLAGRGSLEPNDLTRDYLICDARPLFEASVRYGRDLAERVLAKADWDYDDVDLLVPHQVSLQMLKVLTDAFGRGVDLAVNTYPDYGNVAAANLPIALDAAQKSGRLGPGKRVFLASGAAGFSLGFAAVRW